jgi:hypothetical protein
MDDNRARRFGAEPGRFGRRVDPAPASANPPPRVPRAPSIDEVPPAVLTPPVRSSSDNASSHEDDLRTFFGPNAASYLLIYRAWQKTSPSPDQSILFWHRPFFRAAFWNGLVLFIPWLFYRKLYRIGTAVLIGTIAINLLAPPLIADTINFAIGVFFLRYGQQLYIDHALRQIDKADELGFSAPARAAYLRRRGGRSLVAPVIATAMTSLITGLLLSMP